MNNLAVKISLVLNVVFACIAMGQLEQLGQSNGTIPPNVPPGAIYIPLSVTEYDMLSDAAKRVVTPEAFAKIEDKRKFGHHDAMIQRSEERDKVSQILRHGQMDLLDRLTQLRSVIELTPTQTDELKACKLRYDEEIESVPAKIDEKFPALSAVERARRINQSRFLLKQKLEQKFIDVLIPSQLDILSRWNVRQTGLPKLLVKYRLGEVKENQRKEH